MKKTEAPPNFGNDWRFNEIGILLPPGAPVYYDVVRPEFAVRVQGFQPPKPNQPGEGNR